MDRAGVARAAFRKEPLQTSSSLLVLGWIACATLAASPAAHAAPDVRVEARLDTPTLPSNAVTTTFLRTTILAPSSRQRAPLNVAIVIDKSGALGQEDFAFAKTAVRAAMSQLGTDDIVSVVAFDATVQVLVPATHFRTYEAVAESIEDLTAGGASALFAGTVKGAAEVRKFVARERVNRVILISAGAANVGPASPDALGQLGDSLRREGIMVTTIGLGLHHDEDLMIALAQRSGGSYYFVERARDLAGIVKQGFASLASVTLQDVVLSVKLADNLRPVRVLGRDADIVGQTVTARIPELQAGVLDDLVIECEVRATAPGTTTVASVEVRYEESATRRPGRMTLSVPAEFGPSAESSSEDAATVDTRAAVQAHLALEKSELAVRLRDAGQVEAARATLVEAGRALEQFATMLRAPALQTLAKAFATDAQSVGGAGWDRQRKTMRQRNHVSPNQIGGYHF